MFDQVIVQLGTYFAELQRANAKSFDADSANEALKRLAQMSRILAMVTSLDEESRTIVATIADYARHEQGEPPKPELWHRTRAIGQEAEMLTEAFYYFAFRFRQVVCTVPGFKRFDAKAIRDVRNHLIEHQNDTVACSVARSSMAELRGPS